MATIPRRTALKLATGVFGGLISAAAVPGVAVASPDSGLRFELYKDGRGRFRWRLKAANGQVVATSGQGYKGKADCRNAIELIKRGASTAPLLEIL